MLYNDRPTTCSKLQIGAHVNTEVYSTSAVTVTKQLNSVNVGELSDTSFQLMKVQGRVKERCFSFTLDL